MCEHVCVLSYLRKRERERQRERERRGRDPEQDRDRGRERPRQSENDKDKFGEKNYWTLKKDKNEIKILKKKNR